MISASNLPVSICPAAATMQQTLLRILYIYIYIYEMLYLTRITTRPASPDASTSHGHSIQSRYPGRKIRSQLSRIRMNEHKSGTIFCCFVSGSLMLRDTWKGLLATIKMQRQKLTKIMISARCARDAVCVYVSLSARGGSARSNARVHKRVQVASLRCPRYLPRPFCWWMWRQTTRRRSVCQTGTLWKLELGKKNAPNFQKQRSRGATAIYERAYLHNRCAWFAILHCGRRIQLLVLLFSRLTLRILCDCMSKMSLFKYT